MTKVKPHKKKPLPIILNVDEWNGEDADFIRVGDQLFTFDQMLKQMS